MTTPPGGRPAPPPGGTTPPPGGGLEAAVGVLAEQVTALSREVKELAGRVATTEAGLRGLGETVAEAAGMAGEVTRLAGTVAQLHADAGPGGRQRHPRRPVWAAMNDRQFADAARDLARWVASILLARYPHAGRDLPPCWPDHPAAVEELDVLYWTWTEWATAPDPRSRDAADWHDRYLPAALARLGPLLRACADSGSHAGPASERRVPPELVARGHPPEAVYIENMARVIRADPPGT